MLKLETVKENGATIKKVLLGVLAIAIILISFAIGNSSARTKLNGEKVKYDKIVSEIQSAKVDLETYQTKVKDIQDQVASVNDELLTKKTEFDAAQKLADQKDSLTSDIASLNDELKSKKNELTNVTNDIKSKKTQVASLDNAIKEKQEKPVVLPAGHLTVGKDIKPGRYKVEASGGGGNFIVDDYTGSNVVNTIIYPKGNEEFGVSEYVTDLSEDDVIDAASAFKYTPVD